MNNSFFILIGLSILYVLSASQIGLPISIDASAIDFSQVMNSQNPSPGSFVKLASSMMDPNRMTPQMTAYGLTLIKKFVKLPTPPQQKRQTYKITTNIDDFSFFKNKKKQQQKQLPTYEQNKQNIPEKVQKVQKNPICPDIQTKHKKEIAPVILEKHQSNQNIRRQQKKPEPQQIQNQYHINEKPRQCNPNQDKNLSNANKKNQNIPNHQKIVQIQTIIPETQIQQKKKQIIHENNSNHQLKDAVISNYQEQNKQNQNIECTKVQDEPTIFPKQVETPKIIKKQTQIPINKPMNMPLPSRFVENRKYKNFDSNQLFPDMSAFNFDLPQSSDSKEINKGWRAYEGHNMINGEGNYIKGQANHINGHGNVVICP